MSQVTSSSELLRRLQGVLNRQRMVLFFSGLLSTAAALLATWIGLSLLARLMVLPVWLKVTLLVAVGGLTVYLFVRFALTRLFSGDIDSVAVALEEKNENLKGRLIAAVQFARRSFPAGYSRDLIEATEMQALNKAGQVDFGEVVTFSPVLRTARFFGGAAVLAMAILLLAPGIFKYAFEVYSNPTTRIAPAIAYDVKATPESTEWVKYRDLSLNGIITGQRLPEKAYIHHRLAGGNWQKTRYDLKKVQHLAGATGDSLQFGFTLRQVNRSLDFFVEAGEVRTSIQRIDVVDRPRVTGMKLSLFYPDYTGLDPTVINENNGSFSAVVGTRATMQIEANLPVEKAELVYDDNSRQPLKVDGRTAEVSLLVDKSRGYHVELVDHLGELNPDPIEYYVTAVPDEYPTVDVVRPGFDVNLNDEMILPLLIRIFDDYGFSSLAMKYTVYSQGRASDENVAILHYPERIKTEGDVEFNWDMDALTLFPGDYVSYYFEVADNDVISGPKISRSRAYIARLPSLDEIIAQSEGESTERIVNTEDLIRKGKDLLERVQNATRKLDSQNKTSRSTDYQQQKELESIAESSAEMMDQIEKMANEMDKSLDQMKDNALMSREIMDRLEEIRELFEEVATPEMKEAQKKLWEELQRMNPNELQKAMQDFELSQEELMERLERTLALLKRMKVQEKMEAMVRKAEELVERQSKTNEDAKKAEPSELPELSKAEKETKAGLEELKKEAQDLKELMKEAQMNEVDEAQKFADAVEKTDADQNMEQMSQQLQQQKKKPAGEHGKKAESKLMEMLDQMQQMQMAMNSNDQEMIRKEMRKALDHANNLSQEQEEMISGTRAVDPQSLVMRDLAADQQDLAKACEGLSQAISELGKQSPFVAAELQGLVDKASQYMGFATQELDSKKASSAALNQREAMVNLNKAATRLMESMDQQQQCENGKQDNQSMANLESLCNKQNQLNQKTQGMCDNPGDKQGGKQPRMGDGGEQRRQGLERLAGEQGTIRKSLQQLEREFGGSRQVMGRLSDIADEMRKVEEALETGEVGPETTERQLKIFSRMLEATRTLQRKDYTDRRRAAPAGEATAMAPPVLPQELLNDRVEIEDRLRKFLDDGYPPQYEEQIKAYFRALLKAESMSRSSQEAPSATP